MSRRLWDDETEARVVALYREGVTSTVICQEFGGNKYAVLRAAKRAGVTPQRGGARHKPVSAEQAAEMGRLWHEGLSQTAIGARVGLSQIVVSRVLRQAGIEPPPRYRSRRGAASNFWKGGVVVGEGGYLLERVPPEDPLHVMAARNGYVPQHRLVMARTLGRPLTAVETVHHLDGDRQNNDPANLQLRQGRHGKGAAIRCRACGSHDVEATSLGTTED